MSPALRRAICLALAACAAGPAWATLDLTLPPAALPPTPLSPAAATAPAPAQTPAASEPLVPLPITIPKPAGPSPAEGTALSPQPAPPPAIEVPASPVAPAQASPPPVPATGSGAELFARLRTRLGPGNCEAGSNSARWRARYAGHPPSFARRLQSVLPLIDFVSVEVERAGLPAEFTFIPLVESWYQPGAVGPGGPAGMWQMIASTARNHGIHIREGYDGRLSPVESTRAALSYLRTLQTMFDDWQAIVMAYNAGEGRMLNAQRRAGSRVTSAADRRPHGLSNITYDYVAKLQALSCLVSQPQRFNLHLPVEARYERLVPVSIDPGMDTLDEFAKARGKDAAELRRLNPGFRGGRVIAGVPRLVLAPPGLPRSPIDASESPRELLAMSESDESEVAGLLEVALSDPDALEVGALAAPPVDGERSAEDAASGTTPIVVGAGGGAPEVHPTAATIAASEPVALPVPVATSGTAVADPPAPVHEVRKGESLWSIARQYHLPIEQIRRANKLDDKATVHPGQVLQLVP